MDVAKPYKGPESFEVQDEPLFFGRAREKEQLIAKVLSSRLTLLHAPSGAGKTSVLKAGVLPGLELRGWTPIPIRLGDHPVESVRVTTLHSLLPSPLAEATTMAKTCEKLAGTETVPIGDLIRDFATLLDSDARRSELLQPVQVEVVTRTTALPPAGPVPPLFTRVLRRGLDLQSYGEHLRAIHADAPEVDATTPASALLESLRSERFATDHANLLAELYVPIPGLGVFFENLVTTYGHARSQFGLVLLLDQFEELFTRFGDVGGLYSGSGPKPLDWRLRRDFIDELDSLYKWTYHPYDESPVGSAPSVLPVRFLISLRDEYVAQLEPLRNMVADIDASSYRLGFLDKEQAIDAIRKPAEKFGYGYAEEWYQDILRQLAREDRFVAPGPLQIICEKLWNLRGREIARSGGAIEWAERFGSAATILKDFFREFIDDLPEEAQRLETLDILERLVTSSRTRNIVERGVLIRAPLRDWNLREALIEKLIAKQIVRQERRLGGDFIEITHEFLILPILDLIGTRIGDDPAQREFVAAVSDLERLLGAAFRVNSNNLLSGRSIDALHANRVRLAWDEASTELMFRSVLAQGRTDLLEEWWRRYAQSEDVPETDRLLTRERMSEGDRGLLSLEEYTTVMKRHDELTPDQVDFMLRNAILRAGSRDRSDIVHWVERLKDGA